ncbi:hypothetical protein SAMN02799630_00626 [Paenibacillus sp. UNCCL117]|uniref:hypothetical protein n=1 Tax=unclassified Paenibacillus TaxID=185978 RepID=UPI00088EC313|nr:MULTISPECIES: hypothetical protein [unclassified Paenibacillus]SDC13839.1 hypothetical protein SAMN04488602_101425 [Paenibacillus sp. cl123]SFW17164.1 hypothetical protein SAMN02799630_00626 [Paenibacillus sp. UNCCL117]
MAENNEKKLSENESVELQDLSQEVSEEQMKDVQGGDFHMSTRVIVKKVAIRP